MAIEARPCEWPGFGLFNRPYIDNMIDREWRRCTHARLPLALLLIDLDLFEPYNEKHGHEAGDALLKELGESIAATWKRGNDLAARNGGDEFAVLEAAERALQFAKERGRGRTEAARASSDELPRAA
jgi:diguanylate cyclase (GGDEF)-like protein